MKITYDPEADAAYISFKKSSGEITTISVTNEVNLDLGPKEELVGIEILNASKYLSFKNGHPQIELKILK